MLDQEVHELAHIALIVVGQATVGCTDSEQGQQIHVGLGSHLSAIAQRRTLGLAVGRQQRITLLQQLGSIRSGRIDGQRLQTADQPLTHLATVALQHLALLADAHMEGGNIQTAQPFRIRHQLGDLAQQLHRIQRMARYLYPVPGLAHQHAADDQQWNEAQRADQTELHGITEPVHQRHSGCQ